MHCCSLALISILPTLTVQTAIPDRYARGEEGVCVQKGTWELRRQICGQDFVAYLPSLFRSHSMRSVHEFLEDEMLLTVEDLELLHSSLSQALERPKNRLSVWGVRRHSARTSTTASTSTLLMSPDECDRIAFVCIEDVRLGAQLESSLGVLMGALKNLEVLILKGVGLLGLELCGLARLLYLDLSGNNLCKFDEVLRMVLAKKKSQAQKLGSKSSRGRCCRSTAPSPRSLAR